MGTTGSAPDATQERIRRVFSERSAPHEPLSASAVAEAADRSIEETRAGLEALRDRGALRARDVAGGPRVWWAGAESDLTGRQPSDEEFAAFVHAVEDYAIFTLDPDGVVTSWNEGARRIKGYREDDIVGEHFSAFYTAADVDAGVPTRNLDAAASRGVVEDEGWRVRADGSRFWASVTITAIRDDDGDLRGFTKVTRDMTEQYVHEQRLREERDFTEQLLETVPVSVVVGDADGEIVGANERALDWMDLEEGDLEEFDIHSLSVSDEAGEPIPPDEWPWLRVLETGEPVHHFECQVDLPAVGRRWLSISAAPLDAGDGEEHVVISVDDISERKERERRLRREYDQTEELLRTAPIAIGVTDSDGEVVLANERAREALGLSEREGTDSPAGDDEWGLFDGRGEPLDRSETPSARVLETGEPVFDEGVVVELPDGTRKQFRVNAAPVFGPEGEIERVVTTGEDITELKRRTRQLERRKSELETELSEIFGRISDAFYALDDEWRVTHANARAVEMMGRSREELLDRVIWDVFPDAASVYRERFERAMATQEPVTFEVAPEGIDGWVEFNVYPSETGLSVYFRDVTERKERERRLATYETIVETVDDGIYVKDEDGYFTMVNEAYSELTGYERDELVGAHASLVVDEATIDEASQRKDLIDGETTDAPTMEAPVERADGSRVPTEATFATIDDGDDVAQVGVVRDVSERKEYERRIRESEQRYRTLVENFPGGVVALFDEELSYVTAGGELVDGMEVDPDELVGQSIYDRYPDDVVERIEPHFRAALEGEERSFEIRYRGRDLLAHTLPIDAPSDDPSGMLVVQDISERKGYERRLEASNERLEQFAYAASHDLQEPLRMVSSYLQLIESRYADDLDEDGREFIAFAVDGADRMRAMIDGLLVYSRVDTRGDPFEPVDLDDVLADVRSDLQVRIEETGAEIEAESLPRVEGDADQLRQLFQNLLANAIEYSGDDPPRVHVSAEHGGDVWSIAVRDEGIGVDPADADRIFEVFQSGQDGGEQSGTGIGLAICRRIVERHGGDIRVESEPGEGATFTFTLPVAGEDGA